MKDDAHAPAPRPRGRPSLKPATGNRIPPQGPPAPEPSAAPPAPLAPPDDAIQKAKAALQNIVTGGPALLSNLEQERQRHVDAISEIDRQIAILRQVQAAMAEPAPEQAHGASS